MHGILEVPAGDYTKQAAGEILHGCHGQVHDSPHTQHLQAWIYVRCEQKCIQARADAADASSTLLYDTQCCRPFSAALSLRNVYLCVKSLVFLGDLSG